jgi:hypothetical protein
MTTETDDTFYDFGYGADDTTDYLGDALAANDENSALYAELILDRMRDDGFDVDNTDPGIVNQFLGWAKSQIVKPDGALDFAKLAAGGAGLYALFGGGNDVKTGGWSAPPPKLDATRMQVPVDNTNRRPGEAGQRYFTDVQYTPQGDAAALAGAQTAAQTQATQLATRPTPRQPQANPYAGKAVSVGWEQPAQTSMAGGGQVPQFKGGLESGGFVVPGDVVRHADPAGGADKERGLAALHQNLGAQAIRGPGDAMSDSIPTTIDGAQPAAVANGEAYVPPQEVERAGGANKLYQMMDKLRLERTGSRKQINPDDPKQLNQAYQQGGGVRRFNTGGVTSGTTGAAATVNPTSYGSTTTNTLAPYIGEYVTSALGKGAAMANTPYQAYGGPLTAGASDLQQQSFAGAQQLTNTGFTPGAFNYDVGGFDATKSQQYMNPYLKQALDPQMEEMKRQWDIQRLSDAGRLTKAGAYGGSRQAIMESEGARNLLDSQRKALGEGYMTAYDKGLGQYNLEQGRQFDAQKATQDARQFSAKYAQDNVRTLADLGRTQRDIEAEGIAADKAAFEEERNYAYAQPGYQLGLLSGIPIGGSTSSPNTTGLSNITSAVGDVGALWKSISGLFGDKPA